jgi:hypothetical protein
MERLDAIEKGKASEDERFTESAIRRIDRLKGVLRYTLETEYHARLTEFDRNLRDLDESMAIAQAQYDQYVRARQAATHSFDGYEQPMNRLQADARQAAAKIDLLMERQGRLLEIVAIDELMARRSRLEVYGDKARFALADSYDRATRTQAKVEE